MPPKVTLETVAALMAQGFANQAQRIDDLRAEVNERMDRHDQQTDRFDDEVRAGLRDRPTREEVQALVAQAKNGNSKPKGQWWEAWGKLAVVFLTVSAALGTGFAAFSAWWKKGGP